MVIHLSLSLDDYHFWARLSWLLEETVPQTIPPSKREHIVKYKTRLAHLDESKDDIDKPQVDQPQDDQPQSDAPTDPEEELTDDLKELEDEFIKPEKINPLKRTYEDVWPKFAQL